MGTRPNWPMCCLEHSPPPPLLSCTISIVMVTRDGIPVDHSWVKLNHTHERTSITRVYWSWQKATLDYRQPGRGAPGDFIHVHVQKHFKCYLVVALNDSLQVFVSVCRRRAAAPERRWARPHHITAGVQWEQLRHTLCRRPAFISTLQLCWLKQNWSKAKHSGSSV